MNKKLLKQIKNEWRSNVWLFVELFFVSVLMWYVVDYIYTTVLTYVQPMGFDISHSYDLHCTTLDSSDPNFDPNDTVPYKDLKEIADRLRQRPDVEEVSISSYAVPYSGGCMMSDFKFDTLTSQSVYYKYADPEFFRVFRIHGAHGETPEQLSELMAKGPDTFLAGEDVFPKDSKPSMKSMIGKIFYFNNDSTVSHRLAGLFKPIRYDDFKTHKESHSIICHITNKDIDSYSDIAIRVKENQDKDFQSTLWKETTTRLKVRNMYVSQIESFSDLRTQINQPVNNTMRNYLFGAGFLLLNIFLGLLGTFWFRTQQRRSEVALFKALGATDTSIFGRQMTEGILLLTIATIPAIIIDWNLASAELNASVDGKTLEAGRFIATIAITYLLIALMIFFGNLMPARKAMKVQPAEALHEE